jgi:hypothetical protein
MYAPQIIFLSPPPIHVDLCGLYYKTAKKEQPNKNEAAAATLFFLKL